MTALPYFLVHPRPRRIEARLAQLVDAGVVEQAPNLWQLTLGIAYMYHRLLFRPESVGVDEGGTVRDTRRARLFTNRLVRGPFLFAGRHVNPLDHTGLWSSTEHVIRHILGAFHPQQQADYDLQLIAAEPGALETLRDALVAVVDGSHPQADWLKDLVVYDGYHAHVLADVQGWIDRGHREPEGTTHDSADVTLRGFLRWCALQPDTPAATLRALRARTLDFSPEIPA